MSSGSSSACGNDAPWTGARHDGEVLDQRFAHLLADEVVGQVDPPATIVAHLPEPLRADHDEHHVARVDRCVDLGGEVEPGGDRIDVLEHVSSSEPGDEHVEQTPGPSAGVIAPMARETSPRALRIISDAAIVPIPIRAVIEAVHATAGRGGSSGPRGSRHRSLAGDVVAEEAAIVGCDAAGRKRDRGPGGDGIEEVFGGQAGRGRPFRAPGGSRRSPPWASPDPTPMCQTTCRQPVTDHGITDGSGALCKATDQPSRGPSK